MKVGIFYLHDVNNSTKDTDLEIFIGLLVYQLIYYSLQVDKLNSGNAIISQISFFIES